MKIFQISHACHIIEEYNTRIIFDPVFFAVSEIDYSYFPKAKIDFKKILSMKFDAIFISHHHEDHFCLRSLSLFDKSIPIYIYDSRYNELHFLTVLGFKLIQSLRDAKTIKIGSLKVHPLLLSKVIDECGFLTKSDSYSVLNLVDLELRTSSLEKINKMGPFDLVFFPYQVLNQKELISAKHFDISSSERAYKRKLKMAAKIKTRKIVAGSCGFKYLKLQWRNQKAFYVPRKRFLSEIKILNRQLDAFDFLSGEVLDLKTDRKAAGKTSLAAIKGKPQDYYFSIGSQIPKVSFNDIPSVGERLLKNQFASFKKTLCSPDCSVNNTHAFNSKYNFKIEVISKKKKLSFHLPKSFSRKLVRSSPDFVIQIRADIFLRNMTIGAPYVSILDGILVNRMSSKNSLPPFLPIAKNIVLQFFFRYCVYQNRMNTLKRLKLI